METLDKPLAKNSGNANPKEHIEAFKDLEMMKLEIKYTRGWLARYTLHFFLKSTTWI
jgi:hypothetical protein